MIGIIKKIGSFLVISCLTCLLIWFVIKLSQKNGQESYVWVEEEKEHQKPIIPQSISIQQQISNKLLAAYNSLISPYQQAGLVFLIGELQDKKISFENKLTNLDNILNGSLIQWSEQDKQELKALIKQWQQEEADLDKQRWLTDAEIDWAINQLPENDKFRVLPAYQWHYVQDCNKNEADSHLALTELLKEINDSSKELIFIPVNNPNFHWSLLVYGVKTKTFEYYDTLDGANYEYAKSLSTGVIISLTPKSGT